jgi:hypothetical protein
LTIFSNPNVFYMFDNPTGGRFFGQKLTCEKKIFVLQ